MLRTQRWEPDTHDAVFLTQWDDADPEAPHVCISAIVSGAEAIDPQAVYEAVLAQNRTKNVALTTLISSMDDKLKRVRLDADGDPVIDIFSAKVMMDVKTKFQPVASVNPESGKVTLAIPFVDQATVDVLHAAVTNVHGELVEVVAARVD